MRLIKSSPHVIFRIYDDTTILYNLKYKNYAIVNSVGSDIWECVFNHKDGSEFDIIVNYIANIYRVNYDMVVNDIAHFIDRLFSQRMISIDGKYDEQSISALSAPSKNDIEGEIIGYFQGKHQIYSATFELTYACNEKCVHCYAVSPETGRRSENSLTLNKCKELIDELYSMKCFHLIFTGGDPFMFDGFIDLLQYAYSKHFSFDIYTNGQVIAQNIAIVNIIKRLYPRNFYISLYGSTAKTHDSITQVNGSFERTITAIKLLRAANISVVLNVMIMKPNYHELQSIIKLSKDLDVEYRIGLSLIRKNNGDSTPIEYFINDEKVIESVLRESNENIISMDVGTPSSQTGLLCGAGTTSLCISPNGDVYPCVSLKKLWGSVFEKSLEEIWSNPDKKDYVYSLIWENTKKCSNCEYKAFCPHCIGISEAECGDALDCNYCDRTVARCLYRIATNSPA